MTMHRVLITDDLIEDSKEYAQSLPYDGIKKALNRLKKGMRFDGPSSISIDCFRLYIDKIIDDYPKIQVLLPLEFDSTIKDFSSILDEKAMQTKFFATSNSKNSKTFADLIIERMRYSKVARNLMLKYLKKNHFETCVYCNFMPLPISQNGSSYSQPGELDHYRDKSSYPFLCTSFFNLFPCCETCNGPGKKGNKKIAFYPYKENRQSVESEPFIFDFNWSDIVATNPNDVSITFKEVRYHMGEYPVRRHRCSRACYDKIFGITDLYNTDQTKKKILRIKRNNDTESKEQNETAGPVSDGKMSPLPESERVKKILFVDSLEYENIHSEDLMKIKLDLAKKLGLL